MIRLQRVGKKNEPLFRIVLTEKHRGPKKKYIEELGFYNPRKKEIRLKSERILYWLSKGAQTSATCHNLLVSQGLISLPKIKKGKILASSKENRENTTDISESAAEIQVEQNQEEQKT